MHIAVAFRRRTRANGPTNWLVYSLARSRNAIKVTKRIWRCARRADAATRPFATRLRLRVQIAPSRARNLQPGQIQLSAPLRSGKSAKARSARFICLPEPSPSPYYSCSSRASKRDFWKGYPSGLARSSVVFQINVRCENHCLPTQQCKLRDEIKLNRFERLRSIIGVRKNTVATNIAPIRHPSDSDRKLHSTIDDSPSVRSK